MENVKKIKKLKLRAQTLLIDDLKVIRGGYTTNAANCGCDTCDSISTRGYKGGISSY